MEPFYTPPQHSPLRRIVIDNEDFGFGNVEAWANIIRSYEQSHPGHRVLLVYQGKPVMNFTYLFKLGKLVDREGFEVAVAAEDRDYRHTSKLLRLLVEGAGPDYERFITHEIHRVLKLF